MAPMIKCKHLDASKPEIGFGFVCKFTGSRANCYSTCAWYEAEECPIDAITSQGFVPHESDPTGRKPNDPGAKLDQGKNRLGLVMFGFAKALQEVGKVGTYGAQKYSDNGWMQVPDGQRRYTDALMRHLMKEAEGEEIDPETNLRHAAQVAWNALSRLELMLRDKETQTQKEQHE